jgi:predicted transcriptional regulator
MLTKGTAPYTSTGTYISMTLEMQEQMNEVARARNRPRSHIGQDAVRAYLSRTPMVNDILNLAIDCENKGIDLTPIKHRLETALTKP